MRPAYRFAFSSLVTILAFSGGTALAAEGPVEFVQGADRVDVRIGGKLFTSYQYPDRLPKPVLFPVHTPAGVMACRGFPLQEAKGESTDHPHHAGIFFAYDKVNGSNFWLNTSQSPRIKHIQFTAMKGGEKEGQLAAVMHWIGKEGRVLLEEKRDMVFFAGKDEHAVDLSIDLQAKEKVAFGDTKEGVMAIRVPDWMRETFDAASGVIPISGTGNGKYLNSAGDETEKNVWAKRANWVCLQAAKDGKHVGVALFDHPTSVNHPTYWHARGYGLLAANPLGQGVFEAARNPGKTKPLQLTLAPGQTAHFRYRFLIFDGPRTKEQLDKAYQSFASH